MLFFGAWIGDKCSFDCQKGSKIVLNKFNLSLSLVESLDDQVVPIYFHFSSGYLWSVGPALTTLMNINPKKCI